MGLFGFAADLGKLGLEPPCGTEAGALPGADAPPDGTAAFGGEPQSLPA